MSTLITANARTDVRALAQSSPAPKRSPVRAIARTQIHVPKFKSMVVDWEEWMWREMREGGYLKQYLARERHTSRKRIRRVAKAMHGFKQNNHSEHQLKAAVPMREFFRWKAEDNDFWRDDSNLRSLKRDNPDMAIFV